ncbi:hypothetical protein, partial [Nostoc sp. UHCC 0252]|uniref:hypothetical protein n=1 Tax=Nostoc sp. UHCC 0252 TaxID=3110241 RepID=UPI002B2003FF
MNNISNGNRYQFIETWRKRRDCFFKKLGNCYQDNINPWLEGLWFLRIPLFTVLLSLISFAVIDQTIEVYRVLALNAQGNQKYAVFQAVFSLVSILTLSLSIWYSANILITKYDKAEDEIEKANKIKKINFLANKEINEIGKIDEAEKINKIEKINKTKNKKINKIQKANKSEKINFLANILSILPIFFLMIGLYRATKFLDNPNILNLWIGFIFIFIIILITIKIKYDFPKFEEPQTLNIILLCSIPVLFFLLFTFILIIPENPIKPILIQVISGVTLVVILLLLYLSLINILKWIKILLIGLFLISLIGVIVFTPYLSKPELVISLLGSLNIITISFIGFVIGGSILSFVGYKYKFPILAILLILLTCFSWLDLNDNHRIRQVENHKSQELLTLKTSFSEWKEARKDDIKKFTTEEKEYPIYIVSAQGGGIFAAYHAASTLSRLQDLCPEFASHVFAISGVSGGSLGAAVFSSLINTESPSFSEKPCSPLDKALEQKDQKRGVLETKAHKLLDQDFLSPLLAAGLFPDSLQGFLPVPINSLDRAR